MLLHCTARHCTGTYLMTSLMLFMEAAMLLFSRSSFDIDESCWSPLPPPPLLLLLLLLLPPRELCMSSMLSLLRCTVACGTYLMYSEGRYSEAFIERKLAAKRNTLYKATLTATHLYTNPLARSFTHRSVLELGAIVEMYLIVSLDQHLLMV